MKNRFFSALLAVCMLLTMLPAWTLPAKAASSETTEKEIDQSTYDQLGLSTSGTVDKENTAALPYGEASNFRFGSEVYVAANGRNGNVYTVRDGLDRINQEMGWDIDDEGGNLNGAYTFYGINPEIGRKYGGTIGSALSGNRGSNVLTKAYNEFSGIYATSVAFNGGDGKDNYVAELRAYGDKGDDTGKGVYANNVVLFLFKLSSGGVRTEVAHFVLDTTGFFKSRKLEEELDAMFEVAAGDLDGDGVDEVYYYTAQAPNAAELIRRVKVGKVSGSGSSWRNNSSWQTFNAGLERNYTNNTWGGKIMKRSVVTLACGDLDRDNKEELAVAVSAPYGNAAYTSSHAYVVSGDLGIKVLDFSLQDPAEATHSMTAVNCAFGSFQLPGSSITGTALLVGGYNAYGANSKGFGEAAYRYAYYDPDSGKYVVSDFTTKATGNKSKIITSSQGDTCIAPLALACADLEGLGAGNTNDEVLFGAEVYEFALGSGLGNEIGSISLCTSQVNDNNNNKDKGNVWIGDVAVGCFSSCINGDNDIDPKNNKWQESFLCVVGIHRAAEINSSDDYYWMDVAGFTLRNGKAYSSQEGVIARSTSRNDTYGTFISLCTPNVDDDAIKMRYKDQYLLYTNPEVYAVLQASPYFSDLNEVYGYIGNGGTAYSTSTGSSSSKGTSLEQSLGIYNSGKVELFAAAEYEVEASAGISYEYAQSREMEDGITYNNQGGGDDAVVVYTVPYIYYVYDTYNPKDGSWSETIFPGALTPVTAVLGVEQYDEIAEGTSGLYPVRGNILYSTPGEPSTYVNEPAGTHKYESQKGYVSAAAGTAADVTEEISVTSSTEQSMEFYLELNLKAGAGFGAAANEEFAGVTSSTHAGFTSAWSKSTGTTYSGTVDNLPIEAKNYGMSWKLLVNQASLNGKPVWVVGYHVKDVKAPPKMPHNFTVTAVDTDSVSLQWEPSGSAAYYELYMVDSAGNYNKQVTLPYTVTSYTQTELDANTLYTYSIRAVSAEYGASIFSPSVSAKTLSNNGEFKIVKSPKPENTFAGGSVTFETGGTYLDAQGKSRQVSYQWQCKTTEKKAVWSDCADSVASLSGAASSTLQLQNVTEDMDGWQYRCRVYYNDRSLFTTEAALTVGKADSSITLTSPASVGPYLADGVKVTETRTEVVGQKAISVTDGTVEYTLLNKDNVWYWFDGVDYYAYKGTAPTKDGGLVAQDAAFTYADNVGEKLTVTPADYKATITLTTGPVDAPVTQLLELSLTTVAPGNETITVNETQYTVTKKWTAINAGVTYIFYEAVNGGVTERFYTSAGSAAYQSFALSYTQMLDTVNVAALSTAFQKTVSTVTTQTSTKVAGESVTLTATPRADTTLLTGNVTFAISGPIGLTLAATRQADGSYTASWTPTAEGRYTVKAVFAENERYYGSESNASTFYAVMQEHTVLALSAPANVSYGASATLTATQITSAADGSKSYEPVSAPTYTVQKLVSETKDGKTTTSYQPAVKDTDYTISGGVFTPRVVTTYIVTASYGGKTADAVISVGKGTLTLAATNVSHSVNDAQRDDLTATVTGLTSWDAGTVLTAGTDYKLSSPGTTATEKGEYSILVSLLSTAEVAALQKNYNLMLQNAVYTLEANTYQVSAEGGDNGAVQISYITVGGTTLTSSESPVYVPEGRPVTVTAVPDTGYEVDKWMHDGEYISDNGDYSTAVSQTISAINANESYSVTFKLSSSRLSFDASGNGKVVGAYLDANGGTAPFTSGNAVSIKQKVRLTAVPDTGYAVAAWTVTRRSEAPVVLKAADGVANYTGETYDFSSITSDTSVTVTFVPAVSYSVTVKPVDKDGNALAGVTIRVGSTELTADAGGVYTYAGAKTGDNLTITASIPGGLLIDRWTVGQDQTTGSLSGNDKATMTVYNLQKNVDFTVHYAALNQYVVAFGGAADGAGSVTAAKIGAGAIASGSSQLQGSTIQFTATPSAGYEITGWTLNGQTIQASNTGAAGAQTYQIPNLGGNAEVLVSFRARPQVTINQTQNGNAVDVTGTSRGASVALETGDYIDFGTDLVVTLTPAKGYVVSDGVGGEYTDGTGDTTDTRQYTISAVETSQTIAPAFTALDTTEVTYSVVDKAPELAGGQNGGLTLSAARKSMSAYQVTADSDGDETAYSGSVLTFKATPDDGYKIGKWLVNGEEVADNRTDTLEQSITNAETLDVQVQFDQVGQAVTYGFDADGVSDKATLSATFRAEGSTGDAEFTSNSKPAANGVITVTVQALDDDYTIAGWYVNGVDQDQAGETFAYSAVVDRGADITVKVVRKSYEVTYSAEHGTLTAEADGVSIGTSPAFVKGDTSVIFTATPADGYSFDHWVVDGANQAGDGPLALTVTAPVAVKAVCTLTAARYPVAFGAGENGTLSAGGYTSPAQVAAGGSISFTATPAPGYQVKGWYSDAAMETAIPGTAAEQKTYSISNLTGPASVYVAFEEIPSYLVGVTAAGNGAVTAKVNGLAVEIPLAGLTVKRHDRVELLAVPDANHYLKGWTRDGSNVGNSLTLVLDDVTKSTAVAASFAAAQMVTLQTGVMANAPYTGTLTAQAGFGSALETVDASTGINVYKGQNVVITAHPEGTGTNMVCVWTVNGTEQTDNLSNTLKIDAISVNTVVTVKFERYQVWSIPTTQASYQITDIVKTPADYGAANEIRDRGTVAFTVRPNAEYDYAFLSKLTVCGRNLLDGTGDIVGASAVTAVKNADGSYTVTVAGVTENIAATIEAQKIVVGEVTVPDALEENEELNTPEKLMTRLDTKLTASSGGKAYYDIALKYLDADGNWQTATTEHFPANGVDVVLPYPAGTDKNDTFSLVHMFAAVVGGHQPGDMETITFTKEDDGLHFHVSSLSPFAIGWTKYAPPSGGFGGGPTTYTITAEAGEHGTIEPSGKLSVAAGENKTFRFRPAAGYRVAEVLVDGASVGDVMCYTFQNVSAAHTISVRFAKIVYDDVQESDWFRDAAFYAAENGLIKGTGDRTFSPALSTTRGMLVTILWRMECCPAAQSAVKFNDVAADSYCAEAVAWANENGVVLGYDSTTFGPDRLITREQLAAILYRYAALKGYDLSAGEAADLSGYPDASGASAYAVPALQWAHGAGLILGSGGKLLPTGAATRAQTAAILMRFCETIAK